MYYMTLVSILYQLGALWLKISLWLTLALGQECQLTSIFVLKQTNNKTQKMRPRWKLEGGIQSSGPALSDKAVLGETSDRKPGPGASLGSKCHN